MLWEPMLLHPDYFVQPPQCKASQIFKGFCDAIGKVAPQELIDAAELAVSVGAVTIFEYNVVQNRSCAGLAKRRNFQKFMRELATDGGKSDRVFVPFWIFAQAASK